MAPHNTVTFSGNNNQGFQLGVNQETIGEVVFNLKEENDKCLNDLRLTNPRDDKERIKDTKGGLLEGSYKWILRHPDFQRWRNDDQSRLLWIKGDPGKGKTMLLIGIVDELERQLAQLKQAEQSTSPPVLSYFFCQGTDSNLNNATAVLRGLIYLLAVQQPSLASNLREEYDHSSSKLYEDTNASVALSKILKGMLRDPTLARGYIIIDALDECETGMQQLLKLVVENTSASSVKWIVSSRNRHDIEQQLKLDDSQTKLSLELKANAEYVSHAVGVYIDDRVSQLESLQDDDAPRDQVRHILRQKAANTFLWVALVVQELKAVASWDVLDVLEEIPTGLEELYARMMKQIQQLKGGNPEFCRLMLSTATLAYRPLHMHELSVLSGLPEKISNKAQRVLELVSMCGSFLTVREDRVYIIHQSAKDYLMSDIATTTVFPTGTAEAHRDIFLRSLQTMRKTLRRDIYSLRHPGFSIDDLKMPVPDPLASVRYSCVHWIDHLCEGPHRNDLVDGGLAHKFLEGYLLYWAEALSLLGALSDAVLAVGNLERLLKTMSTESSLLSLTVDAHRFLLHNGLVIKSAPLQTYVSALLFSPTRCLMRELFKKEEPQWVFTGPGVGKHWGPLVRTLESQDDSVWSVAFSPDGKLIASGSDNRTIKVWDAATGEVKRTLEGHHNSVLSVVFSLDGKLIASGSDDRTIKIWDAATGEIKHTLEGHGDAVRSVAFSPDGKLIASGSNDRTIKVWNTATGEVKRTLEGHGDAVRSVAFSPDGKLIALGSGDETKVWDAATGEVKRTLEGHGDAVLSVAFSPDGKLIALGSGDETKVWDVATGEVKCTLEGHSNAVLSVAFSPNGKLIVSGSNDWTIKVWDAVTGEIKYTLEGYHDSVGSVVFSPDGKLVASGSDDKTIKVWDAATSEIKRTLKDHCGSVLSVAFSPDGKLVASGSDDRTIKVWDAATSEVKRTLEGHCGSVLSVAFSPDGKLIASGSDDRTIKVWDAATSEVKHTFESHREVYSVSFDTTGLYLFTSIGCIKVDARHHIDAKGPIQSQPQEARQCGYSLNSDRSWITWKRHKVLYLPSEYRPSQETSSAIWQSVPTSTVARVAIGCDSGRFIITSFSKPPPGLPSS